MIFDAHFHIIDPAFPIVANEGFVPEPFRVADYLRLTRSLDLCGGVVVSGSFQAYDQSYLIAALRRLGPSFVGVTQLMPETSDAEIVRLAAAGVRGIRFNLRRGLAQSLREIARLSRRVYDLAGWHTELYADMADVGDHERELRDLPSLCVDHLGLSAAGLPVLLRLVEGGARVKATGFGRVDLAVQEALRAIHTINPRALVFGSDLPGTRAPRPFCTDDLRLIDAALGVQEAHAVRWSNALDLYRMRDLVTARGPSLDTDL